CSSRRRHTRSKRDWSSDVCSSDLNQKRQPSFDKCTQRLGDSTGNGVISYQIIQGGVGLAQHSDAYTSPRFTRWSQECVNAQARAIVTAYAAIGKRLGVISTLATANGQPRCEPADFGIRLKSNSDSI